MVPWTFMDQRLREILPDVAVLTYYGRPEAASPAVGSYHDHMKQEQLFVGAALDLPETGLPVPRRKKQRKPSATQHPSRISGSPLPVEAGLTRAPKGRE